MKITKKYLNLFSKSFLKKIAPDYNLSLNKLRMNTDTYIKLKKPLYDICEIMNTIQYGFISIKDNTTRITNRSQITKLRNSLYSFYKTNDNPEITLHNKLGLCLDQSLLEAYLINKKYPTYKTQIYLLTKNTHGHAVTCFYDPNNHKWFYLENAWNKEKGIHGPFSNIQNLKNYICFIYYKNHTEDNTKVSIKTYKQYLVYNTKYLNIVKQYKYVSNLDENDKNYNAEYDKYIAAYNKFNNYSKKYFNS